MLHSPGADDIHPRDLLLVGDDCIGSLSGLWKAILKFGDVLVQLRTILSAMIEKPGGGHGPTGLLSAFVRVLFRM
eukprot:548598-Pyramimonas_sp.AAC.1